MYRMRHSCLLSRFWAYLYLHGSATWADSRSGCAAKPSVRLGSNLVIRRRINEDKIDRWVIGITAGGLLAGATEMRLAPTRVYVQYKQQFPVETGQVKRITTHPRWTEIQRLPPVTVDKWPILLAICYIQLRLMHRIRSNHPPTTSWRCR